MDVDHDGSSVSVAGESRITSLGAKLRRYKLDELLELWNVLVDDMSFVGPRPDVPRYADLLEGEDREVLRRRPGLPALPPGNIVVKRIFWPRYLTRSGIKNDLPGQGPGSTGITFIIILLWMDLRIIFATLLGQHFVYNGEII